MKILNINAVIKNNDIVNFWFKERRAEKKNLIKEAKELKEAEEKY